MPLTKVLFCGGASRQLKMLSALTQPAMSCHSTLPLMLNRPDTALWFVCYNGMHRQLTSCGCQHEPKSICLAGHDPVDLFLAMNGPHRTAGQTQGAEDL